MSQHDGTYQERTGLRAFMYDKGAVFADTPEQARRFATRHGMADRDTRAERDADTRRVNRDHYRGMTLVSLLNHAHAALPQVRLAFSDEPGDRRLARSHAAGIAAIAHELAARGDHHMAAMLRAYRHTARTSRAMTWTQDINGRAVPVALPPAYDVSAGRMRHPRQVARTRARGAR